MNIGYLRQLARDRAKKAEEERKIQITLNMGKHGRACLKNLMATENVSRETLDYNLNLTALIGEFMSYFNEDAEERTRLLSLTVEMRTAAAMETPWNRMSHLLYTLNDCWSMERNSQAYFTARSKLKEDLFMAFLRLWKSDPRFATLKADTAACEKIRAGLISNFLKEKEKREEREEREQREEREEQREQKREQREEENS